MIRGGRKTGKLGVECLLQSLGGTSPIKVMAWESCPGLKLKSAKEVCEKCKKGPGLSSKATIGKLNYTVAQCEGRPYTLFNHAVLKAGKLLIEK